MISISIIMPLYNAEKYLAEALQSVLNQTYRDFEVICIDDGSNDGTMEILHMFQRKDERIKIILNQERMGAAISRNRGIKAAQGEYITFLDGDDIFEEEMLEVAYRTAKETEVDIVMYEYKHMPSGNIYSKQMVLRSPRFIQKYCKTSFSVSDYDPIEFLNWSSSPCNKLYRKSLIDFNSLEFQSLPSSNDVFFVEMALFLAKKIIMLDDRRVMVYARDHFEESRISTDRNPMCVYEAIEKIGEELEARKILDFFREYYLCFLYASFHWAPKAAKKEDERIRFYNFLKKEGLRKIWNINSKCFENADKDIKNLLTQCMEQKHSEQRYLEAPVLLYYLAKHGETLRKLLRMYGDNHVQTVLWGAGAKGGTLLKFLHTYGLTVSEVVDKDKSKHGQMIYGYEIKSPDEIWTKTQIILVTSYEIYSELLPMTQERRVKLINVEEVLGKD